MPEISAMGGSIYLFQFLNLSKTNATLSPILYYRKKFDKQVKDEFSELG